MPSELQVFFHTTHTYHGQGYVSAFDQSSTLTSLSQFTVQTRRVFKLIDVINVEKYLTRQSFNLVTDSMKSKSSVTLGLIQMNMADNPSLNLGKAERLIDEAAKQGAQIVCLPELFNSLYFPQEEKAKPLAETIPGETTVTLSRVAKRNKIVLVGGSIYEKAGGKCYNTAIVFDEEGGIIGKYRKVHIPNDPNYYEQSYFDSGTEYRVFTTRYGKIGVLICFDQWYPEPARIMKLSGADIIFYPTTIGSVRGIDQVEGDWHEAWESVQRGHAISNSIVVAAVNRVGREKEMTFWGGSFTYDQFGKLLLRADDTEGVFLTTCDLSLGTSIEEGWGFLRNRKPHTYTKLLK
ncbi:MAG: carbon-nitrogen hydrolase [Candidatus Bathyarchaeia archaeon]